MGPSGVEESVRTGVGSKITSCAGAGLGYIWLGMTYVKPSGLVGPVRSGVTVMSSCASAGIGNVRSGMRYLNSCNIAGPVRTGGTMIISCASAGLGSMWSGLKFVNSSVIMGSVRIGGTMIYSCAIPGLGYLWSGIGYLNPSGLVGAMNQFVPAGGSTMGWYVREGLDQLSGLRNLSPLEALRFLRHGGNLIMIFRASTGYGQLLSGIDLLLFAASAVPRQ